MEKKIRNRQKKKSHIKMEAEIGVTWPKTRNVSSHQTLEEAGNIFS